MTQEEKLEDAKRLYETANADQRYVLESLFPELKESEDEKVRKALIELVKQSSEILEKNNQNRMIAWLEKQGKQKPTNKVEPKFKVGDWIVSNEKLYVYQIEEINDFVAKVNENGVSFVVDVKCLNDAHLWTIQDAKDGDVLQLGEVTAIFQKYIGNGNCKCYCSICNGDFEIPSQDGDDNSYGCHNAIPATKEQRDLLFQKMHEAKYMWDSESKQLLSLKAEPSGEQRSATIDIDKMVDNYANNKERGNEEFGKPVPCMIRAYRQGLNDAIGKVVLKPAWSEEDEEELDIAISTLKEAGQHDSAKWLKSIKDKVQPQPKQEWSEEDAFRTSAIANSLKISRNGNSRIGETLEEAAKNHKSAIHIVSPQWTSEVENAFIAGAEWQKEQMIVKACEWLEEHLLNFWLQKFTNTDYFIEDFKQAMNN